VPTGKAGAAEKQKMGALTLQQREDCEVIRPDVWRSRQTVCDEAPRLIRHHEVEPSVRAYVHAVEGLVIQLEWERQSDHRIDVIAVISRIGVTRHDRVRALSYHVLARRTTLYCVTAVEGRARIAKLVIYRSRGNIRCQVPTESNIQRELYSHVSWQDSYSGH